MTQLSFIDIAQTDATSNPTTNNTRLQAETNTVVQRTPAGVRTALGPASTTVFRYIVPADILNSGEIVESRVSIPPGKSISATMVGVAINQNAALTGNRTIGFRIVHGAGANGNVIGTVFTSGNPGAAAAATTIHGGVIINLAAGATQDYATQVTVATATRAGVWGRLTLTNTSSNATATVSLIYQTSAGGEATVGIGSALYAIIG